MPKHRYSHRGRQGPKTDRRAAEPPSAAFNAACEVLREVRMAQPAVRSAVDMGALYSAPSKAWRAAAELESIRLDLKGLEPEVEALCSEAIQQITKWTDTAREATEKLVPTYLEACHRITALERTVPILISELSRPAAPRQSLKNWRKS